MKTKTRLGCRPLWAAAVFLLVLSGPGAAAPPAKKRVAIVGAGIGGAAAAYFLQGMLRNRSLASADVTVYERSDRVGGRLKHITFGAQQAKIEVGGAAWMSSNFYVRELAAAMRRRGVSKSAAKADDDVAGRPRHVNLNSKVGVWNGKDFVGIIDVLLSKALSVVKSIGAEKTFLQATANNYKQSEAAAPFTSIRNFIRFGALDQFTNRTIQEYFGELGVNAEVISDGLVPVNRSIYNQNANASAFSMLGSLAALVDHEDWPSGNSDLVQALFAAAKANIKLSTKVHTVTRSASGRGFTVTTESSAYRNDKGPLVEEEFDAVLIAAPLEVTGIEFPGIELPPGADLDRGFMPWHVTVVEADRLNVSQFPPSSKGGLVPPQIILTTANGSTTKTPWVCISRWASTGKMAQTTRMCTWCTAMTILQGNCTTASCLRACGRSTTSTGRTRLVGSSRCRRLLALWERSSR